MEELIEELNSPVNQSLSERVQEIQRRIQQRQRQKSAWQEGFKLLDTNNQNFRFYGALTLTIKINADWESDGFVQESTARQALLQALINAYVRLVNVPDAPFVLLKLCSTLTAYFIKDDAWQCAVRQVCHSLLHGQYVGDYGHAMRTQSLSSVSFNQLRGMLWFASTLVEDISRIDTHSSRSAQLVKRLIGNSEDIWPLLEICFDSFLNRRSNVQSLDRVPVAQLKLLEDEALEVFELVLPMILPWLEYMPPDSSEQDSIGHSVVELARKCVSNVFACFSHSTLQDLTIQTLTGIAESFPKMFRHIGAESVASITTSMQAAAWVDEMLQGEFSPEAIRYVEFLIALMNNQDLSSSDYLKDKVVLANLITLKQLMRCEGAAVVEDEACQLVLECLNEVVEQYSGWNETAQSSTNVKSFVTEVCLDAIAKSRLPGHALDASTETWDADDRARFQDFRNDVSDFLAVAFVSLGSDLIEAIARSAVQIGDQMNWSAFEASLFCLLEFSDTVDHNPEQYDPIIQAIMSSSPWAAATDIAGSPSKVRQMAIKFVAQQTGFLRRNLSFLIPCLNFLFSSLQAPGSSQAASRAIQTLCFSERKVLVEALQQFLSSLSGLEKLESTIRHRLYGAVAAIVQALPTESDRMDPLNIIVNAVASLPKRLPEETGTDIPTTLVDMLQGLAAIGRGLRAPSGLVIDLEDEPLASIDIDFWTFGAGHHLQQRVLSLCTYALNEPEAQLNAEVIEAACDFVKSGYTESDPSPFKFSAAISVDFVSSQIRIDSPNIDAVMSCASTFLASIDPTRLGTLFAALMDPVFHACRTLVAQQKSIGRSLKSDLPTSSIEFLTRLLPKWSSSLLTLVDAQENMAAVFDMTLDSLAGTDTLSRRVAASFFAAVFELTGHNSSLSEQASGQLTYIMNRYTPFIIALILKLLAGDCARSEIEAVTEPLRKLIMKQTQTTRRLLKEAMAKEAAVLNPKAYEATTLEQRLRFIAQVEALRGARKTIEVARDFWLACRGNAFGYVT